MKHDLDYNTIETRTTDLLEKYEAKLDKETQESVLHFIEHDEYEMAFEGLFT